MSVYFLHILFNGNVILLVHGLYIKNYSLNDGHLNCQIFATTDTCTMNILTQVYFCILL